jgi:hypothetical protein
MGRWLQWKTASVEIERSPEEIYDYVVNPEHFPEWATSFCLAVRKSGDGWSIDTTRGEMNLRFAERNPYGIMDHYVKAASGPELLTPARVVPSVSGSWVIMTMIRPTDREDPVFALDFRDPERDLQTLKHVLER